MTRFRNRRDAGRQLAAHLAEVDAEDPVVLGLPRGGVPVAFEVATALHAPLDVLVVRKLGVPWQPEVGMGALGEDGGPLLNDSVVRSAGVSRQDIDRAVQREQIELDRRVACYRPDGHAIRVAGRRVIVVDDGLATGGTARAAIDVLRHRGAERIILAIPVAPSDVAAEFERIADDVVCLATPNPFIAIGRFYVDFSQTSDQEVISLLSASSPGP